MQRILFLIFLIFSLQLWAEIPAKDGKSEFNYSLHTASELIYPPSKYTFSTAFPRYNLIPKEKIEIVDSSVAIDKEIPAHLDKEQADYFLYLNRCCWQSCCFEGEASPHFEGVDEKFTCGDFEDYFCCCCACCCCEEDYYGEGTGSGGVAGSGGFGGAGFTGFGSGGSGGSTGNGDTTGDTDDGTTTTTTAAGPTVIIPEPSFYLILASAILIAIYVRSRRKKKA